MEIIEKFQQGKISDRLCEDALVISEDFVAVVDGVTAKSPFRYKNKTTGRLAAEIIAGVLRQADGTDPLAAIIAKVNAAFADFYAAVPFPCDRTKTGLQAAAVIYSARRREIWMIGDCQAAVDGSVFVHPKKSDQILSATRALILSALVKERGDDRFIQEHDPARDVILPWILQATAYANDAQSEYGYSVFNGEAIPMELIKVIHPDSKPHEIVLASDGYPVIRPTLRESEDALQKMLREDPGCYRHYLSTKGLKRGQPSFDDRTYVRFRI